MDKNNFKPAEYAKLLNDNFPEHIFNIELHDSFKKGAGDIYRIGINKKEEEEEYTSFMMLVGFLDFTEDEMKENFKNVAGTKITLKEEEIKKALKAKEEERKKALKEQEEKK